MTLEKYYASEFTKEMYLNWISVLPEEKQKKIQDIRKEKDRFCSVIGYMLAVKVINENYGIAKSEIEFFFDGNGKPFVKNEGIFISISHSDDLVICAVSDKVIGVDIEKIRNVNLRTVRKFCTEEEKIYIFGKVPDESSFENVSDNILLRFFEIWTKKEAYGKMLGSGVLYDMKNTDVSFVQTERFSDYIISVCEGD